MLPEIKLVYRNPKSGKIEFTDEERKTTILLALARRDEYNEYYRILTNPTKASNDEIYEAMFSKTSFGYRMIDSTLMAVYID